MIELMALAEQCAPQVAPETVLAIAKVESTFNPFAIGVVGTALKRQPRNLQEALATVAALEKQGRNFSIGIAQVNRYNLPKYGISYREGFDPCANLRVGSRILHECYARALPLHGSEQHALRAAFSCYYSGNFIRGFRPDRPGDPSYVQKVVAAALGPKPTSIRVPSVRPIGDSPTVTAARAAYVPARPAEGPVLVAAPAEGGSGGSRAPQMDDGDDQGPAPPLAPNRPVRLKAKTSPVAAEALRATKPAAESTKVIDSKVVF
ncbi:lytic transglycosylase domain-containing protein [Stenotrophomonas maltophilia]|uniref:lytic transglycosylase domain-containing protein n=1 Tax=Stenotrophomonas maltophilia TaxID=40324 RepID=UPI001313BE0C